MEMTGFACGQQAPPRCSWWRAAVRKTRGTWAGALWPWCWGRWLRSGPIG